jgi:hypothetical protein
MKMKPIVALFLSVLFCAAVSSWGYSTNLGSNDWNLITNNIPGTGNPISISLNSPDPTAFFLANVELPE